VIASVESSHTLDAAIEGCRRSCGKMSHEIFVVDASRDDSAEIADSHPDVCLLSHPPGTVVPLLWADGIRRSSGRRVALSTGHCIPSEDWASSLVNALDGGAEAAGAGLLPQAGIRGLDYAVFFLRYSGFLEITRGAPRSVPEVPGDNAAYNGEAVRGFMAEADEGFWELEYHEEIRARGGEIRAVPAATVGFGRSFPLATILRHRFDHGRHFGAWRAQEGGMGRLRVVLPAPLVPFVLLLRTLQRLSGFGELRGGFARSVVPFLLLGTAWAAGEATGALVGAPDDLVLR
jgi:Glycosyl transferase family 2